MKSTGGRTSQALLCALREAIESASSEWARFWPPRAGVGSCTAQEASVGLERAKRGGGPCSFPADASHLGCIADSVSSVVNERTLELLPNAGAETRASERQEFPRLKTLSQASAKLIDGGSDLLLFSASIRGLAARPRDSREILQRGRGGGTGASEAIGGVCGAGAPGVTSKPAK